MAADALAVALCHLQAEHAKRRFGLPTQMRCAAACFRRTAAHLE